MKDITSEPAKRLAQVAQELHKLADAIGAGKVRISGVDLTISDSVTLKVKQKMTGEKVFFDLKIQALLASKDTRSKVSKPKHDKPGKETGRAYGAKSLKKKYVGLWRVIAAAIKKGGRPEVGAVYDLGVLSKEYGEAAPADWAPLWQEHEILVTRCITCAHEGDFVKANELLREIGTGKKTCHKLYK